MALTKEDIAKELPKEVQDNLLCQPRIGFQPSC
jgi:hypothetical protein